MRAHKEKCLTCGRTIKVGKKCPLSPHMRLATGKLMRPISPKALARVA